jgi:hypothetical protein
VLPYDHALVENLLAEHTRLRRALGSAEDAARAGDIAAVVRLAVEIRSGLRAVARVEALRVFPWVRRSGPEDETYFGTLDALRAELAALSRRLMRSLDAIEAADHDPVSAARLTDELAVLSRTMLELVLAKGRLLYPLYQPDRVPLPPRD